MDKWDKFADALNRMENLRAREAELKLEQNKVQELKKRINNYKSAVSGYEGANLSRAVPGTGTDATGGMLQGIVHERNMLKSEVHALKGRLAKTEQVEQELKDKSNELGKNKSKKTYSAALEEQIRLFQDSEEAHLIDLENSARGFAYKVRNYPGIISGTSRAIGSQHKLGNETKTQVDLIERNAFCERRIFIFYQDPRAQYNRVVNQ